MYHYAGNNPIKYTDPDGNCLHILVGAAIGAVGALAAGKSGREIAAAAAGGATAVMAGKCLEKGVQLAGKAISKIGDKIKTPKIHIDSSKYPETAQHVRDAQANGYPSKLTINRTGATANRAESLKGYNKVPGKQLDEYPPAMFKEGGFGADIRAISPSDNMGAGDSMVNQLRNYPNGTVIKIVVD